MSNDNPRISTDDTKGGYSRIKEALGDPLDKELTRYIAYIVVCIHFNIPIRVNQTVILLEMSSQRITPHWETDTRNK